VVVERSPERYKFPRWATTLACIVALIALGYLLRSKRRRALAAAILD
jgi:hypothetical protein